MERNQNLVFRNFSLKWPKNIVKEPNCYKSLINASYIDLVITNSSSSFQNTKTNSTGLSDFHKMATTVLKQSFQRSFPKACL